MIDKVVIRGETLQEVFDKLFSKANDLEMLLRNSEEVDIEINSSVYHPVMEISLSLENSTLNLDHIFLRPNLRRVGFGKVFFYYLESLAKKRGATSIKYVPSSITINEFEQMLLRNGYRKLRGYYEKELC